LWVDKAEEIDSVISKFQAYTTEHHVEPDSKQYKMQFDPSSVVFTLVTVSRLQTILQRYEKRPFSSKPFYESCVREGRLTFFDGPAILTALTAAFRKISELPGSLRLNLESPPIQKDEVLISLVSSDELKRLYAEFGDSLFFENIRDFLNTPHAKDHPGRTTPNQEIVKTVRACPEKMLSRNNGIVFRAETVTLGEKPNQVNLTRGSIVNGLPDNDVCRAERCFNMLRAR
jgi:AIPR protein